VGSLKNNALRPTGEGGKARDIQINLHLMKMDDNAI